MLLALVLAAGAPAQALDRADLFRTLHGEPASLAAPPPGPGAWYGFRNGLQNQGLSALELRKLAEAAPGGREPWAVQTHGVVWGTPVVDAAGNVYAGSADKTFRRPSRMMLVRMMPGQMAVTPMPCGASSMARDSERPTTANLAAQ